MALTVSWPSFPSLPHLFLPFATFPSHPLWKKGKHHAFLAMFSSLQMPTRPQCRRAEPNGSHRSFSSISSESQRHRLRRPGWVVKKRPNASEDRRACGRGPCGGPRGSAPCPPADWRTRPSGGAAGGERRPGRRHREVPPGPRGCGRTPGLARCNLGPPGWPSPPRPPAVT